jgi:hypothetical protein
MNRKLVVLTFLAALWSLGCRREMEPDAGGPRVDTGTLIDSATPMPMTLRIEPQDEVRTESPVSVTYTAFSVEADGTSRDVTSEVTWSSTLPGLGTFTGNVFTSAAGRGGLTNIVARLGSRTTTTTLTIRVDTVIIVDPAPADAPTRFEGTVDPTRAPALVYPLDGAAVPPNLGELEFHYRPNGSELFELRLSTSASTFRIYMGCPESVGGGCAYTLPRDVWEAIAMQTRGQGPIEIRLRGVNAAGQMGEAATQMMRVVEEPITGGLYYWNAGEGSIDRFEFGVPGARAERFIDRARATAGTCVGCHALSRDGTRIAVGTDIPTTTWQIFDVATRTRLVNRGAGGFFPSQPNFGSFSPDSTQIVTSALTGLTIRSATEDRIIVDNLGGGAASQPDWSADGNHIVFVRHDAPAVLVYDALGVSSGRIVRLDRVGDTWTLGPTLVNTPGANNYYPAYSPDGNYIVYNHSPSNTGSAGADPDSGMTGVPDAQIMIVPSAGGDPIRLSRLMGLADSWAKWDPTVYRDGSHDLFWLTWSSRRAFGLRVGADVRAQLWMAAVDPSALARGEEGVTAPFRLPFQNIATSNHIAQWVTSVERAPCVTNAECPGEFCVDGRCFAEVPIL